VLQWGRAAEDVNDRTASWRMAANPRVTSASLLFNRWHVPRRTLTDAQGLSYLYILLLSVRRWQLERLQRLLHDAGEHALPNVAVHLIHALALHSGAVSSKLAWPCREHRPRVPARDSS